MSNVDGRLFNEGIPSIFLKKWQSDTRPKRLRYASTIHNSSIFIRHSM
jgi:hypothetical protein